MKNQLLLVAVAIVAMFSLPGCVTAPDLAVADYGSAPENAQARSREWIGRTLKDPESAQYRFGELQKAYIHDGILVGGAPHFGWVQVVEVNGKNGYGGYVGFETQYIFFEHGENIIGDARVSIEQMHNGRLVYN